MTMPPAKYTAATAMYRTNPKTVAILLFVFPVTVNQLFHQPIDQSGRRQRQEQHRHSQYSRGNQLSQRRFHKFCKPFKHQGSLAFPKIGLL